MFSERAIGLSFAAPQTHSKGRARPSRTCADKCHTDTTTFEWAAANCRTPWATDGRVSSTRRRSGGREVGSGGVAVPVPRDPSRSRGWGSRKPGVWGGALLPDLGHHIVSLPHPSPLLACSPRVPTASRTQDSYRGGGGQGNVLI